MRRLCDGLDQAGILHGEEALGDHDIKHDGQHDGADRDQQRQRLVAEHHDQAAVVERNHMPEPAGAQRLGLEMRLRFARCRVARPPAQELRAQHRHQGERHHRGDQDGDGERDREFAEQAADDIAHEQERDQHRDQRHRERHDREGDLARAFERCFLGIVAALDVARDVLDHDDGIVDHEAGGDGERHDRQVVEAEAREIHHRQGADQRQRHRQAGDERGTPVAEEEEDHADDQDDGKSELDLHIAHRGADGEGAVGEDIDVERGRQGLAQLRQQRLDAVDDGDDVGAGLALDVHDHRLCRVGPGGEPVVLLRLGDGRHVGHPHRRAVAIGDDDVAEGGGIGDLVVGVDGVGARRAVEIALGRVDVGVGDRGSKVVDIEPVGGERRRIGADPHAGLLAALEADETDAGKLGNLLGEPRIHHVVDLGERLRFGGDGERQDGRVSRVHLGVDRRRGQIGGQQVARGIDGRLDLLLGHVETELEVELQRDRRCAGRTGARAAP